MLKLIRIKPLVAVCIVTLLVLSLGCILAFLSPYDPYKVDFGSRLLPPGMKHLFGTDDMGRDYLTRILYGGRISLIIGFLSMIISTLIGTLVGTISGYFGGVLDSILMRSIEVLMSIPSFFIIITLNLFIKSSIATIIIIIALFNWMGVARIIRSETMSIREREYVLCAISQGIPPMKIILTHILPNILPTIIVSSTINVAGAILMESALSFLGLGVTLPAASWGNMLQNAQSYIFEMPILAFIPGIFILITVLAFNILGDEIKKYYDPKSMV